MEKNKREGGKKMTPQFMSFIDPYVYQTLQTIRGKEVIIETVRGNVQGVIQDVKPDHIVLKVAIPSFCSHPANRLDYAEIKRRGLDVYKNKQASN